MDGNGDLVQPPDVFFFFHAQHQAWYHGHTVDDTVFVNEHGKFHLIFISGKIIAVYGDFNPLLMSALGTFTNQQEWSRFKGFDMPATIHSLTLDHGYLPRDHRK